MCGLHSSWPQSVTWFMFSFEHLLFFVETLLGFQMFEGFFKTMWGSMSGCNNNSKQVHQLWCNGAISSLQRPWVLPSVFGQLCQSSLCPLAMMDMFLNPNTECRPSFCITPSDTHTHTCQAITGFHPWMLKACSSLAWFSSNDFKCFPQKYLYWDLFN